MFAAEDDGSPFYRFEAILANDSSIATAPLILKARRANTEAALGPLRADLRGLRTFVPLYLTLHNVTAPLTVHFVVITRGGVIYRWGATTQCPIASSTIHIETASRNSKCSPMAQYDKVQELNNADYENKIATKNHFDENNILNYYSNNLFGRVNSHGEVTENGYENMKNGRSYNVNTNEFDENYNHDNQKINKNNKTSDYIIRNMNQNDKNNYLHKNMDVNGKNHTIYDRFSAVYVKPNIYEKSKDENTIQDDENVSDALLDRHLLRVMLPIKVTQQMCPDSHLIAYFYYNGEFVSASKHFEMDDCFVNKVEATFLSRQALPASQTTLQITTPGPALCALTALDSAAKWNSHNSVKEILMKGLRRMIDAHRNVTEYDAAGDCFLSAEVPPLPANGLEQTASWLAAAGVRTVGDITIRKNCEDAASLVDDGIVPRSDFSEAWLWRLVAVGANGTVYTTAKAPDSITRYEANAVCLSKTGVAVSQPAVLQVFREFFIHADSPGRLRRGDSTIIRYRLFNYLYEPLSVQIQILTSSHLRGPSEVVESACVPPRASTARRGAVVGRAAGEGTVTLRARAVRDGGCGNATQRGVSDEVIMKIIVEPEGVPVEEHKSMMLCGKDHPYSTKSEISWTWSPATVVPRTENLVVWAAGDIIGPLLADADSLVVFPRGCGEQNMARAATNLAALALLPPRAAPALAARLHVARGFTRQLQYIHPSGGFSAFGPSDATSSTWLTAFSLRYLRRAHKILWPNLPMPPAIQKAEQWLLNQQMENGCFRNEGQVFHRELRGGLNEEGEIASVALTAYVITSLLDSPSSLPSRVISNTLSCLRALPSLKYNTPTRVYAHALLAYAFMKLNKYEEDLRRTNEAKYENLRSSAKTKTDDFRSSNEANWLRGELKEHEGLLEVMELLKMARKEGEYLWWETGSLATSIEATSYGLLALRESPSAFREFGAGAIKWLSAHRGPSGGFVSTQDTLVALEALIAWSSLQSLPSNLTVSASSGSVSSTARLHPGVHIPEVMKMPIGDKLTISVEGSGCALVQATRRYNTPGSDPRLHKSLSVQVSVHTDGSFDCDATQKNCFCAAVVEACAMWSGPFPEMALMEISLPGGYGADAAKLYSQLHLTDSLLRRIELSPSNSRVTLYLAGAAGPVGASGGSGRGHACFYVHSVGPRARTRPAYVRLMDYYAPTINDTQIYTIPEECPSRVSHESSQDLTSDNLYNKARSLSDSEEILITHDFTFDDIPEGIPLEDPLYGNLAREKDDSTIKSTYTELNSKRQQNTPLLLNDEDGLPNVTNSSNDVVSIANVGIGVDNKYKADKIRIDGKLALNNDAGTYDFVSNHSAITLKTQPEQSDSTITFPVKYSNSQVRDNNDETQKNGTLYNQQNIKDTFGHVYPYSNVQKSIPDTPKTGTEENVSTMNEIITDSSKPNHRIEIRDEHESLQVNNPNLNDFHIIDSDKDLDVPSGLEGPIPVVVLPPVNFVPFQYLNTPNFGPTENIVRPQNGQNYDPEYKPQNFAHNHVPPQYTPSENAYTTPNVNKMQHYYRRRIGNYFPSG